MDVRELIEVEREILETEEKLKKLTAKKEGMILALRLTDEERAVHIPRRGRDVEAERIKSNGAIPDAWYGPET